MGATGILTTEAYSRLQTSGRHWGVNLELYGCVVGIHSGQESVCFFDLLYHGTAVFFNLIYVLYMRLKKDDGQIKSEYFILVCC